MNDPKSRRLSPKGFSNNTRRFFCFTNIIRRKSSKTDLALTVRFQTLGGGGEGVYSFVLYLCRMTIHHSLRDPYEMEQVVFIPFFRRKGDFPQTYSGGGGNAIIFNRLFSLAK